MSYAHRQRQARAGAEALQKRSQRLLTVSALVFPGSAIALLAVLRGEAGSGTLLGALAGLAAFGALMIGSARLQQREDEARRRWRVNTNAESRCRDPGKGCPRMAPSSSIQPTLIAAIWMSSARAHSFNSSMSRTRAMASAR